MARVELAAHAIEIFLAQSNPLLIERPRACPQDATQHGAADDGQPA
jgi:hypothetical protein